VYEPFVDALLLEIEHQGRQYGKKEAIDTIYFGGGTPSLLPLDQYGRIFNHLGQFFDLSHVQETTIEVNPDDMNLDYLLGLRSLGFDRLSIGIQSFFDADLQFMGRAHNADQAYKAIELARKAGFENFSTDLIFGLPNQSFSQWLENLNKMIALEVPHISTYSLTIEEKTPLFKSVSRGLIKPFSDEDLGELYTITMDFMEQKGYEHYEISSFARPNFRAIHNSNYWEHKNYIGFGPSAHSFWWDHPPSAKVKRWANVRNLKQYQTTLTQAYTLAIDEHQPLVVDDLINEYIMLRLRTREGLDLSQLENVYGYDLLMKKLDEVAWLETEKFIYPIKNHYLRLSNKGKLMCDAITQRLLK
jgi:oxygen-independent coproporphyrinogen-3 oxidase